MNRKLVVSSWVGIHEGCDITYKVNDSESVDVTISGDAAQPFEFVFYAGALRAFMGQVSNALAEMDANAEREEAEWAARSA